MEYVQANTNGRLHDAMEPSLSPLNRGFLYGDAIYEVWRTYGGVLFAWSEHWERLEASAEALGISIPWSADELFSAIAATAKAFRTKTGFAEDVYVRLQIFRGEGAIGLDPALADRPGYIILVQPVPRMKADALLNGLKLSISRELKRNPIDSLSPAWKTGNYLNNMLCLREAKRRGADDVVILNHLGQITESSTSNIAFIQDGCFITPPKSAGILVGVTRRTIIEILAERLDLKVLTTELTPDMLPSIQECMLLSSTKDVQPVASIDAFRFEVGETTVTYALKAEFERYTVEVARENPDRRI